MSVYWDECTLASCLTLYWIVIFCYHLDIVTSEISCPCHMNHINFIVFLIVHCKLVSEALEHSYPIVKYPSIKLIMTQACMIHVVISAASNQAWWCLHVPDFAFDCPSFYQWIVSSVFAGSKSFKAQRNMSWLWTYWRKFYERRWIETYDEQNNYLQRIRRELCHLLAIDFQLIL